jgi:hypothetical protein
LYSVPSIVRLITYIQEEAMGGTCSIYGGGEKGIQNVSRNISTRSDIYGRNGTSFR